MILKILIVLGILIVLTYIVNRHARLGYPNTLEEKLVLFISGFIGIGVFVLVLSYTNSTTKESLGFLIFAGIFGGFLFAFGVPNRMKGLNRRKDYR